MATVNSGTVPAERIVTIGDFVERVYLPWTADHKRPSTARGYRDIWEAIHYASAGERLANGVGKDRIVLPALNRCGVCQKAEPAHSPVNHKYVRDDQIPQWRGWHAARRGLGSNLYRLGVADMVIQRILRRANVSTTATYYIKTAADDVRNAMTKLENVISETPMNATPEKVENPEARALRDTKPRFNDRSPHGELRC